MQLVLVLERLSPAVCSGCNLSLFIILGKKLNVCVLMFTMSMEMRKVNFDQRLS